MQKKRNPLDLGECFNTRQLFFTLSPSLSFSHERSVYQSAQATSSPDQQPPNQTGVVLQPLSHSSELLHAMVEERRGYWPTTLGIGQWQHSKHLPSIFSPSTSLPVPVFCSFFYSLYSLNDLDGLNAQ